MKSRAGVEGPLEPVLVQGLTLPEFLLVHVIENPQLDSDFTKIAAYNKVMDAYSKAARVKLETAHPDLAAKIQERQLLNRGLSVGTMVAP